MIGKTQSIEGISEGDATPFCKMDVDAIADKLKQLGVGGKQMLIDGRTGEMLKSAVCMGTCYYHRLRHMVADKHHSRANGPKKLLTRQPTEGRSNNGGGRFGEMEKDSLIAHGAASIIIDRLSDNSDGTPVAICNLCHRIAEHPHSTRFGSGRHANAPWCRNCKSNDCTTIKMPFASTVLDRELEGMHFFMRKKFKSLEVD